MCLPQPSSLVRASLLSILFLRSFSSSHAQQTASQDDGDDMVSLRILTMDYPGIDLMGMERLARDYHEKTGVSVVYDKIPDYFDLHEEIRSQAQNRLALYDGYVCNPFVVGGAAQFDGWMDLTETVRTREDLEWQDLLPAMRENIAVYDNKVTMLPLDGDAHFMFYRDDVLRALNQTVPRTWDEYWQVAKAIHGQEFEGKIMSGSCVGRMEGFHNSYWATLVLGSYTQTKGPSQGHLFDPETMEPLAGEALAEVLKMVELQATYGHPLELERFGGGGELSLNIEAMNNGTCALTYNWGDSYKAAQHPDSTVKDTIKVARTPGSTKIYNRATKKLEACTEELCGGSSGSEYHDDIGWVNRASYLAFGGWSAAVNNNIDDDRKRQILDFFVYMASPEVSVEITIVAPDTAANETTGTDPYRSSHLDPAAWEARGYERLSALSYTDTVKDTFKNPNAVVDMRFAGADRISGALDREFFAYLSRALVEEGSLPSDEKERHSERLKVADALSTEFREIIADENNKPSTQIPVLTQYQLALGLYKPPIDHQTIGNIRAVGWVLAAIIVATSVGFAAWVVAKRETRVIKGSQPFFLLLICFGTLIMGSALFPLGMDDDFFGKVNDDCPECDSACQAWPWLLFIGFTIVFCAIFSKLWRLNKFIANAKRKAKNIHVEAVDVILPFAALLTTNVILLSIWQAVDPLVWQRIPNEGDLSSYGTCKPEKGTPATVLGALLVIINVGALLLAEIEAYRARNVSDHLSESKYIGLATVSMFQMFVIGIPVIFLVQNQPEAQYFVYSGIIFVICMAILSLIFLPKVHFDRNPPPKASIRGSGTGLNVQLPTYKDLANSSMDMDKHDDDDDDEEDETTLELARLRNAVDEYKFKFLALKKEVENKNFMQVDAFLASLDRENQEGAEETAAVTSQQAVNIPKKSKFWTESGFDIFSEYVPPVEQVSMSYDQNETKDTDDTTARNALSSITDKKKKKKHVAFDQTSAVSPSGGNWSKRAVLDGWGKSEFEVFSEAEHMTEVHLDRCGGTAADLEVGALPTVAEA